MSLSGGTAYVDVALGKTTDLQHGIATAGEQAADTAKGSFLSRVGSLALGGALANGLTAGVSSAFSLGKSAIFDFNSQLQQANIGFTTMLGSSKAAGDYVAQLQQFAKTTPFEFGDLVQNAQQMMGMGIAAKDVIPDLRALGDSVASIGGGAQQVNSVTLAFDQMSAKGTLDMGNMQQIMQNGVPSALKILAAHYKVTTGEMIQMISTGKVQSSEALPALVAGLENGTSATAALGGMMDKQSRTMAGALSNIKDSATQAIAGAFKPVFDAASASAQGLANFLGSDAITKASKHVSDGLTAALGGLQTLFYGIKQGFDQAYQMAGQTVYPITEIGVKARIAFDTVHQDVQGLVDGFQNASKYAGQTVYPITAIGMKAREAWDAARPIAIDLWDKIKSGVQQAGPILKALFLDKLDTLKTIARDAYPIILNLVRGIGPVLGEVLRSTGDLLTQHLLPAFLRISELVQQQVIPRVADLVSFAVQHLIPIFHQIGDVIAQKVEPMLGRLVDLFVTKVMPALQPLIRDGFGLLKDAIGKVLPIAQQLIKWFSDNALPIIEDIATVLIGKVIPFVLQTADVLLKVLRPAFDVVVWVARNVIIPAIEDTAHILLGLIDAGVHVAGGISDAVHGIAGAFGWLKDQVVGAKDFVVNRWNDLVSFIGGIPGRLEAAGKDMFGFIASSFKSAINIVIRGWDNLQFTTPKIHIPGTPGSWDIGPYTIGLPFIQPLEHGGLVLPTPGGTVVRVAEAGKPEIVSPIAAMEGAMSRVLARQRIGRDSPLIGTVNMPAGIGADEVSERLYFQMSARGLAA